MAAAELPTPPEQLPERQPAQAHARATKHLAARKSDVCVRHGRLELRVYASAVNPDT